MMNTKKSILDAINATTDESEIDMICVSWLKLLAMDHGKEGDIAIKLLSVVDDLIT